MLTAASGPSLGKRLADSIIRQRTVDVREFSNARGMEGSNVCRSFNIHPVDEFSLLFSARIRKSKFPR